MSRFRSWAGLVGSLAGMFATARPAYLTPPRSLAAARGPLPPEAIRRRASLNSRSRRLRSSSKPARRAGSSAGVARMAPAASRSSASSCSPSIPAAGRAGGDGALRDDLEEADSAGAPHMRAAAQLDREGLERVAVHVGLLAHGDDAHLLAVFLAEEGERAGLLRLIRRHQARRHFAVLADKGVDLGLDDADVLGRERARLAEIEAQPVGRHQPALLRHVLPQAPAQRLVPQMRHAAVGWHRAH